MNATNARLSQAAGSAAERREDFYRFFAREQAAGLQAQPERRLAEPAADPAGPQEPRGSTPRTRPPTTGNEETPRDTTPRTRPGTPADSPPAFQDPTDRPGARVPHFADVPDSAKHPAGPYVQAPEEYGGEWWFVNPFVGSEPWKTAELVIESPTSEPGPEEFVRVFGERPQRADGESTTAHKIRLTEWEHNLKYFVRTGIPEGFDPTQVELASATFEAWGMGEPQFYEGRYGWRAAFPDSAIPDFEFNVQAAVTATHIVVARYQARLIRDGLSPAELHPFLPESLREESAALS